MSYWRYRVKTYTAPVLPLRVAVRATVSASAEFPQIGALVAGASVSGLQMVLAHFPLEIHRLAAGNPQRPRWKSTGNLGYFWQPDRHHPCLPPGAGGTSAHE